MRHIMAVAIAAPGTPAVRVVVCHRGNRNCWRQMGMGAIYDSTMGHPTANSAGIVPRFLFFPDFGAGRYFVFTGSLTANGAEKA